MQIKVIRADSLGDFLENGDTYIDFNGNEMVADGVSYTQFSATLARTHGQCLCINFSAKELTLLDRFLRGGDAEIQFSMIIFPDSCGIQQADCIEKYLMKYTDLLLPPLLRHSINEDIWLMVFQNTMELPAIFDPDLCLNAFF